MKANLPVFSTKQYGIAFFLLMLLAVLVQGLFILHEINSIESRAAQKNRLSAQQDIATALAQASESLRKNSTALAQWDEARQQYFTPAFYNYWRESRALSAGLLSKTVKALDLYDLQGKSLNQGGQTRTSMPALIPPRADRYITREGGVIYAYQFVPLHNGVGHKQLIGWAGIKLDLQQEIANHKLLHAVGLTDVQFALPDGKRLPWEQIGEHVSFSIPANPAFTELAELTRSGLLTIITVLLVFLLLGFALLHFVLVRPLLRLADNIFHMQANEGSLLQASYVAPVRLRELETIRLALNDYRQRVDSLNLNLEYKNRELWDMAHVDPLSQVYNRRAFESDWQAILNGEREIISVALLLFDCDHFKAINDTYGHPVGDDVIRGIASSLQKVLRGEDRLYRLGGDEFCTLLYDMDINSAHQVAERCLQEVKNHDFAQFGIREPVNISIGLAFTVLTDYSTIDSLLKQADLAMYQAKRPGSHKIVAFNAEMEELSTAILSNPEVNAVFQAIQHGTGLTLHYQPIMALPDCESDYFEALCRIEVNDTLLTPGRIFPIVEMRRLEVEFDQAIINAVTRDLERGVIPPGTGISVNISGPGIINPGIIDGLKQLSSWLGKYKIVLEITETALITQLNRAVEHIDKLRELGFLIALDDFGSGYSSLRYLSGMPVDIVKFDISLVHCLMQDKRQSQIVENLAHMILQANYKMVAEGVDSTELLERVKHMGFTHAQGFLLGKPTAEPVVQLFTAE